MGKSLSLDQVTFDKNGEETKKQFTDPAVITPSELSERQEIRTQIKEAISSLPDKYAHVFILREIEELSYEEIAEILGISIETVGVRLIRASEMLQKKLEKIM